MGLVFIPLFITRAINHPRSCPTQTAAYKRLLLLPPSPAFLGITSLSSTSGRRTAQDIYRYSPAHNTMTPEQRRIYRYSPVHNTMTPYCTKYVGSLLTAGEKSDRLNQMLTFNLF